MIAACQIYNILVDDDEVDEITPPSVDRPEVEVYEKITESRKIVLKDTHKDDIDAWAGGISEAQEVSPTTRGSEDPVGSAVAHGAAMKFW